MLRTAGLRLTLALACVVLGGCVWGSDYALTSIYSVERSPPVGIGSYVSSDGTAIYIDGIDGNAAQVRRGDYPTRGQTLFKVVFTRVEGNFYMAQAQEAGRSSAAYVLIKVLPRGFELYQPSCADWEDRPIALAAGAYVDRDACIFTSLDQVMNAMRGAVREMKADPYWGLPKTYVAR